MIGHIWYYITHLFLFVFFKIFCHIQIEGQENLPAKGAFIMAGNHTSYMDPPLFGAISTRRVNCMAQNNLFKIPFLGWLIKTLGAFPVDRENPDSRVLKTALAILKRGEIVGIYPEGRRILQEEKEGKKNEKGVAFLAKNSGAPVIPVSLIGSKECVSFGNGFPRFKKVKVIIGKPIYYKKAENPKEEKDNMSKFSNEIMRIILEPVKLEREKAG